MTESSDSVEQRALPNPTRRRFARQAVVGSTVLLSLGNRTAWGQDWVAANCISTETFMSYAPGVGFSSVNPNHASKLKIAEDIDAGIVADSPKPKELVVPGDFVCREEPKGVLKSSKTLRQRDIFSD